MIFIKSILFYVLQSDVMLYVSLLCCVMLLQPSILLTAKLMHVNKSYSSTAMAAPVYMCTIKLCLTFKRGINRTDFAAPRRTQKTVSLQRDSTKSLKRMRRQITSIENDRSKNYWSR